MVLIKTVGQSSPTAVIRKQFLLGFGGKFVFILKLMEQADSTNISFILVARHSNRQIFRLELVVDTVIKVHFGVEYLTCRFRLWLRRFLHNRNCRVQRIQHCFGIPEDFNSAVNNGRNGKLVKLLVRQPTFRFQEYDGVSVAVTLCDIVAVIVQFFKEVFLFVEREAAHGMSCSVGERTRGHRELQHPCNLFGILIKELIEVPYSDSGYCIGVCAFQAF